MARPAEAVLALTALLSSALLPAQSGWRTVRGRRVPLPREERDRFASRVLSWVFPPPDRPFPGSRPHPRMGGLAGLLARRVRPERTHYDPGAEARTYALRIRPQPEGKEKILRKGAVLRLFPDRPGGSFLVLFERILVPYRKGRLKLWRARLAEGLAFRGPGGRPGLLVDGDGDGAFVSPGKDLLLLGEGREARPMPLTETLLTLTGAWDLKVDREDRISWRAHVGGLGLLQPEARFFGGSRLREVLLGTGRVFRLVQDPGEPVPVTPGRWFLFEGRLAGGFLFSLPPSSREGVPRGEGKGSKKGGPPGGLGKKASGVLVKEGRKAILPFGAPFTVDFSVEDRKDRLILFAPKVRGSAGEVYRPDPERFGKGEIPFFLVEVVVGRPDRPRKRKPLAWIPWAPGGKGRFRRQRAVVPVGAHWAPIYLRVRARRGPFSGAAGMKRVR